MGNDLQDIQMPELVTFRVTLTTPDALGVVHRGLVERCWDSFDIETSTVKGDNFVRSITVKVPPMHAIEVFTYLYHCMEVGGYVMLLQMEPIVGAQAAMYPETFTITLPGSHAEVRFIVPNQKDMTILEHEQWGKEDGVITPHIGDLIWVHGFAVSAHIAVVDVAMGDGVFRVRDFQDNTHYVQREGISTGSWRVVHKKEK